MSAPDSLLAEGYLVIEAVENQYGVVNSAKFVKATTRLPSMQDGQRAVFLRVRVPASAFGPIASVSVRVPEGALIEPVIEVVGA